ncbi:hypothetical protein [Neptunomonas japonica]|uniref:Uncharacterized protein n=1 Tax=Neptunomonas japonica JAMM 1380 TaxID=1441457 RepID=A0A7R6PL59_9GAMM|nr:hypothetical protein [Neptunomonas japonica]BBB28482.1 conserved hypothetical protein [Neptunomonas japonica JAMM 1380]
MQKLLNLLRVSASGKLVLLLWVVTMATFSVMWFLSLPAVEHFVPGKVLFDLSFTGYSYEYAVSLLDELGVQGRDVYLYLQLPVDFIFPGLLAISSALLLTWVFSKGYAPNSRVFYFAIVPFLGGLFDYLENISILQMIYAYPNIPQQFVNASSAFTQLKTWLTVLAFLLLLVGVFRAIRNYSAITRN